MDVLFIYLGFMGGIILGILLNYKLYCWRLDREYKRLWKAKMDDWERIRLERINEQNNN